MESRITQKLSGTWVTYQRMCCVQVKLTTVLVLGVVYIKEVVQRASGGGWRRVGVTGHSGWWW